MRAVEKGLAGALAGASMQAALAFDAPAAVSFEPRFLRPGPGGPVDLSAFAHAAQPQPGEYWLEVRVNDQSLGRMLIPYRRDNPDAPAQACFDRPLLRRLGVATQALAQGGAECRGLADWLPHARVALDFAEQRLTLEVPQASVQRQALEHTDAEHWDAGVTTGFVGYDLSVFDVDSTQGPSRTQGYAGFSTGLNLGNWQLRHQGNLSSNEGYQSLNHYAQRELASWGAQARFGQVTTTGELLEAVQMRGAQVFSDDRMLPASQRGFAPQVRGVARSNARVAVRQGGRLLREVVVPPGPFVIDDLYAATVGGDLQVTVTEADASEQHFTVTNAAAPLALRAGQSRYAFGLGQLFDRYLDDAPLFAQGTWQQGLSDSVTGYTGMTVAQDYQQGLIGSALNTSLGAVGLDLGHAHTQEARGERLRLSYSTLLEGSSTRLGASHQRTSAGYYSLLDAHLTGSNAWASEWRERGRTSLTLNQPLGNAFGQLNAGLWWAHYGGKGGDHQGYALSYAHRLGQLGYGLSATRERDRQGREETLWQLSVSLPLGGARGSVTAGMNHSSRGYQAQAGYRNGNQRFNYGASVDAQQQGDGARLNAYGGWRASFGEFAAAAGQGPDSRQLSASARGAVVAHGGGVTLAQPLSETFALVQVPDARGARVVSSSQVQVDRQGYAVVPHLVPYQVNRLDIDPLGLPLDVELATNSQQVIPRAGAVPLLHYPTRSGRTALFDVRLESGERVPFGAQVSDGDGQVLGVVGQASRVLARGVQAHGHLYLRWGEQGRQQCTAAYRLAPPAGGLQTVSVVCKPTKEEET